MESDKTYGFILALIASNKNLENEVIELEKQKDALYSKMYYFRFFDKYAFCKKCNKGIKIKKGKHAICCLCNDFFCVGCYPETFCEDCSDTYCNDCYNKKPTLLKYYDKYHLCEDCSKINSKPDYDSY
jgi:hypothetical protein